MAISQTKKYEKDLELLVKAKDYEAAYLVFRDLCSSIFFGDAEDFPSFFSEMKENPEHVITSICTDLFLEICDGQIDISSDRSLSQYVRKTIKNHKRAVWKGEQRDEIFRHLFSLEQQVNQDSIERKIDTATQKSLLLKYLNLFYSQIDIRRLLPVYLRLGSGVAKMPEEIKIFYIRCYHIVEYIKEYHPREDGANFCVRDLGIEESTRAMMSAFILRKILGRDVDSCLLEILPINVLLLLSKVYGGKSVVVPNYKQICDAAIQAPTAVEFMFSEAKNLSTQKAKAMKKTGLRDEIGDKKGTKPLSSYLRYLFLNTPIQEALDSVLFQIQEIYHTCVERALKEGADVDIDKVLLLAQSLDKAQGSIHNALQKVVSSIQKEKI